MCRRLPRLRVPRSIRLLAAIFILVIVLATGAVYLPRLGLESYRCLQFVVGESGDQMQYAVQYIADVNAGSFGLDQRSVIAPSKNYVALSASPNGKYRIFSITPDQGKRELYLEEIGSNTGILKLETDATNIMQWSIFWHPQSTWFAYIINHPPHSQLVIVYPEKSERKTVDLGQQYTEQNIFPFGVSGDGSYYGYYDEQKGIFSRSRF